MNKSDLVTRMSERLTYLDKQDIEASLSCLLEKISETLHKRNRVELRGFGMWSANIQKPRISRNPKTGEKVHTKKKLRIHFKMAKELFNKLNNEK